MNDEHIVFYKRGAPFILRRSSIIKMEYDNSDDTWHVFWDEGGEVQETWVTGDSGTIFKMTGCIK